MPLTPEEADSRVEDWEQVADQAPAGLIGPTQLNLPSGAPREDGFRPFLQDGYGLIVR